MELDLDGPALAPPEGVTPNFDNPPNQNDLAWGVLVTCCAVATISVLLRAYGRIYLLRKFQAEEILVTLAYGCAWGSAYATFAFIDTPGYFVHQWDVRLGDLIPTTYWILVFGVCYSFVLPFLKSAILIEWCRLFVTPGTKTKSVFFWGCMAVIFVQVGAGIAIIIALNFQCIPHKRIYDFTVPGKCWDLFKLQVASATIHLVSDIAIFMLPQRIIWKLNMSWRKRLGVSVIFGLGFLACVSAAFRLAVTVAYGRATDAIFNLGPLVFWASAEMTCGFFIVCVPCIPKILKDTGVMRKIKGALGMKSTKANSSQKWNRYGSRPSNHSKVVNTTNDAYYELDEDGIPMKDIKGSESTEHLQNAAPADGIVRTTRIAVTQDSRSVSDGGSNNMYTDHRGGWAR